MDLDYVPLDRPLSVASDYESVASGDIEVVASAPLAPPSPRRTRSMAQSGPAAPPVGAPMAHTDVSSHVPGVSEGPPSSASVSGVSTLLVADCIVKSAVSPERLSQSPSTSD